MRADDLYPLTASTHPGLFLPLTEYFYFHHDVNGIEVGGISVDIGIGLTCVHCATVKPRR